ncbi:MAG: hypothetical protein WC107_02935 [Patescibacteria group bacterium]
MAADKLECSETQVNQAAAIIRQLEILRTDCVEAGNQIGSICCQIAIIALSMIEGGQDD